MSAGLIDRVRAVTLNFQLGSETPVDPGTLGGVATIVLGGNDADNLVGYSYPFIAGNIKHAFIWNSIDGMQNIGTPGTAHSFAFDVNEFNEVVGYGYRDNGSGPAFFWDSSGGMQTLPDLGGSLTAAVAINDSGEVVGYGQNASGDFRAFYWNATDGIQELGDFGGSVSYAFDINDDGFVVGSAENGSAEMRAFLWNSRDGMIDLGFEGRAFAINASEQVTGYYQAGSEQHGLFWDSLEFHTNFESTLPSEITAGSWTLETMDSGSDGTYGDHGFSGSSFMITPDTKGTYTLTLTLTDLPTHTSIDLGFLLACINRVQNNTAFSVEVDGTPVFSELVHWDPTSDWNPGAPATLFENLHLGYQDNPNFGYDWAVNMGFLEPGMHSAGYDFDAIPHTASTLTIEFIAFLDKNNDRYAIDDLTVILNESSPVTDLGTLSGTFSFGRDIDDDGQIVGEATLLDGSSHAFVWDSTNGMVDLNDYLTGGSGWTLQNAWNINASGNIAGSGSNGSARGYRLENP